MAVIADFRLIKTKRLPELGMVGLTMIWGLTFPLTQMSVMNFPPLLFLTLRFFVAAFALLAFFPGKQGEAKYKLDRTAVISGTLLFLGFSLQTIGLRYTTPSRSALLTSLCVLFVPLIEVVFFRKRFSRSIVLGIVLCLCGIAFLNSAAILEFVGWQQPLGNEVISNQKIASFPTGDVLSLLCALAFAAHIISLDHYGRHQPILPFAGKQALWCALLALFASVFFERAQWRVPNAVETFTLLFLALHLFFVLLLLLF